MDVVLAHASDSELLVAFDQAEERRGRPQSSRYKRQQKLLTFSASLSGRGLLDDVTTNDVEIWLATCRVKPRSRSDYVGHASAFFRWALGERLVGYDPAAVLKRPHGAPAEQDQGELFELLRGFQIAQERRAHTAAGGNSVGCAAAGNRGAPWRGSFRGTRDLRVPGVAEDQARARLQHQTGHPRRAQEKQRRQRE